MIACSAFVNDEIRKEATDLGFDMTVEAPINSEVVKNILNLIEKR